MAQYNSLKELFVDVCDVLRLRDGSSSNIKHNEIADKIRNLNIKIIVSNKFTNRYGNINGQTHEYYNNLALMLNDMESYIGENPTVYYDFEKLFYGNNISVNLNLNYVNKLFTTNTSYMFYNCSNLTSLEISNLETSNTSNMSYMFYGCKLLTSLDLSNFNTINVNNMSYMFSGCNALTSINGSSNFDTSKVTNMAYMFNNCTALTTLDVSNFDTSNVTAFNNTFNGCKALTSLDVSKWNATKVTTMQSLFNNCNKLTSLDLSKWNATKVTNVANMFSYCNKLEYLKIGGMFNNNTGLTTISMFASSTYQNIILDFDGNSFSAKTSAVTLNLATIWRGTDDTKKACFESFANSLGVNNSGYTRTIKIYTNLYRALTDEQKALITDKGYTLTYGTS